MQQQAEILRKVMETANKYARPPMNNKVGSSSAVDEAKSENESGETQIVIFLPSTILQQLTNHLVVLIQFGLQNGILPLQITAFSVQMVNFLVECLLILPHVKNLKP